MAINDCLLFENSPFTIKKNFSLSVTGDTAYSQMRKKGSRDSRLEQIYIQITYIYLCCNAREMNFVIPYLYYTLLFSN